MLNLDRYHAVMGSASLRDSTHVRGDGLGQLPSRFYVTQRKLPFAPCLGHERLVRLLSEAGLDRPRVRFLEGDRAGLGGFAAEIEDMGVVSEVRAVPPGTIVFAGEPFADVVGPFAVTQAQEIKFEHAFDLPMTTAAIALELRMAAGDRWLSDFSLRRDGDIERAVDVATYAFIGGFNDTSNMEAAHRLGIPAVGTEAHYWQQAFIKYMDEPETDPRTGRPKHFEQVAFERWLDANPKGTTLLLDTIDVHAGAVHAAMAATSTEARRAAFKGFRVDSGNLAASGKWCHRFFELNGLTGLTAVLTGDLDVAAIRRIVEEFPEAGGFGVGTKLSGEVARVAGVIFKLCEIDGVMTLKASNTPDKSTLPGRLQVFRGVNSRGNYTCDVIGFESEMSDELDLTGATSAERLLQPFWEEGRYRRIPSVHKLKRYVAEEVKRFGDIRNYPVKMSRRLREARDALIRRMHEDHSDYAAVLKGCEPHSAMR